MLLLGQWVCVEHENHSMAAYQKHGTNKIPPAFGFIGRFNAIIANTWNQVLEALWSKYVDPPDMLLSH